MIDEKWKDYGQLLGSWILLQILFPYLHHVAQNLKRNQWVDVALVLEQDIEERLRAMDSGLIQYVREMLSELFVDVRIFDNFKFPQVHLASDLERQILLDKAERHIFPAEGLPEELVVGVREFHRVHENKILFPRRVARVESEEEVVCPGATQSVHCFAILRVLGG